MGEKKITMLDLAKNEYFNSYYTDVLMKKMKAATWLINCIENIGSERIKTFFALKDFDEIEVKCRAVCDVEFSSSHSYEDFYEDFINFCSGYYKHIGQKKDNEKDAKRADLLRQIAELDEI